MNKEAQDIFDSFWEERADVEGLTGSFINKENAKELFELGIFFGVNNN